MATSTASRRSETHLTDIPDHLVAEIFLRLPDAEDLARAAAACVSFRRLVAEKSFLRRFRRLHAPPLLGHLDSDDGFHPAVPPHPSAPAGRALSLAADFTFSFLPSHCRWAVQDVRDGRVLLDRETDEDDDELFPAFTELVVCDPLHRRYILLPPLPDDLAALVEDPVSIYLGRRCEPILIPPSEEDAEETAFRVIWFARCKIKLYIFVFSSSTGEWRAAASQSFRDLLLAKGESTMTKSTMMTLMHPLFFGSQFACGCVYWELVVNEIKNHLLVLDTRTMEFSIADPLPKGWNTVGLGIVEAGEDKLGMFSVVRETPEEDLRYIIGGSRGLSSTQCQWQVEKTISLHSEYQYCIETATGKYLLLARREPRSRTDFTLEDSDIEYFSLDIWTLQLQVWGKPNSSDTSTTHLYTNFPPSLLSSPTV